MLINNNVDKMLVASSWSTTIKYNIDNEPFPSLDKKKTKKVPFAIFSVTVPVAVPPLPSDTM